MISNYKIYKYKLKFLYSLKKKNFVNSGVYLKKYSQYKNLDQFGGSKFDINIKSKYELNNLIENISKLLTTIFDEKISKDIISEFKSKVNFNDLKYPEYLNLDLLIKNIFKSIYTDAKTEKLNDDINNKIDFLVEDTIKKLKSSKKEIDKESIKLEESKKNKESIKTKKSDNYDELKKIINLLNSEKPIDSIKKKDTKKFFNPIFIQHPLIYYSFDRNNKNKNDFNVKISESSTTNTDTDNSKKIKSKYLKKEIKKNIIIY